LKIDSTLWHSAVKKSWIDQMVSQKCRDKMRQSTDKMSIEERQRQLIESPEFQEAMSEWEPQLHQLGSTTKERLQRILTLTLSQMTAYSDPMIKKAYNDPKYLAEENEEMDRILTSVDLLIILAEGGQTLNAGTLARYAWLHEYTTDPVFKAKVKRTIDRLIQLSDKYLYDSPAILAQTPLPEVKDEIPESTRESWTSNPVTSSNLDTPPTRTTDGATRIDLDALRQSVYDLIDRYPGQVLFLEYLTRDHRVDNMTPAIYKNLYQYYSQEYSPPRSYVKVIVHKGTRYDFRIQTFQGRQAEFPGPEILAFAFGYAISGMNLITISRRK
jgi:hypothetical protein